MTNNFYEVDSPKHITVHQTDSNITITRKWLNSSTFSFIGFVFVYNSFLLGMIGIIVSTRDVTKFITGSMIGNVFVLFVFGLISLIGIYLFVIVISILLNKTYIFANKEEIIIYHKPLPFPWLNNKKVRTTNLKRLYSKKVKTNQNPGQYFGYKIYASTDTGSKKTLLLLSSREETVFIERKLESYYQIEEEAKPGEIGVSNPIQNPKPDLKKNQAELKKKINTNQINTPETITISQTNKDIILMKKWGNPIGNTFITIFTTFWNGFLLFFTIFIANATNTSGEVWVLFILLPLFFFNWTVTHLSNTRSLVE